MKRILFIAPHSFPISSSESICNSKIAYTLAEMGYLVDVISCSESYHYPGNELIDRILSQNANLRVYRVETRTLITRKGSLKANLMSLYSHIRVLLKTGYFYNGALLPYDIINKVLEINEPSDGLPYDYMITRGFRTDIAGIYLKKKYGIYWLANWNDPYTEEKFPPPYGKGHTARLNPFKKKIFDDVQRYADFHSFPCSRLRNYMLQCFTEVDIKNTIVIPHMATNCLFSKSIKLNKKLSLVHCGNVRYPRDPSLFIQALALVKKENLIQPNEIHVSFIGMYDKTLPALISKLNLENEIELKGMMPYAECQKIISESTLSMIIEAKCDEGIYLPTKFVDALQVSTPVFCVSPKIGTLRDLINEYCVGYVCDNESVDDIKKALIRVINDFRVNSIPTINKGSCSYFFDDNIKSLYEALLK